MGQKKWYVVIVGKAVGVFTSWWVVGSLYHQSVEIASPDSYLAMECYRLEVAPLVVGVAGAQHQSFPTEEEATQAFRDEVSKGTVKS